MKNTLDKRQASQEFRNPAIAHWWVVVVLLVALVIGLCSVKDSGIMWDEDLHAAVPHLYYNFLVKGEALPFDIRHYGPFVDISSNLLFKMLQPFLDKEPIANAEWTKLRAVFPTSSIIVNPTFYHFKHYYTFLISFLSYLAVSILVGMLFSPRYASFGILSLLMIPRYWGHSYFNPKDAPFAGLFTFSVAIGALLMRELLKTSERRLSSSRSDRVKILSLSIAFGVVSGLATAVRIGGGIIPVYLATSLLAIFAFRKETRTREFLFKTFQCFTLLSLAWSLTVYICHPAAWFAPLSWLSETISYMSQHPYQGSLLYKGQYISNHSQLNGSYIPGWFLITTPVLIQLMAAIGVVYCLRNTVRFTALQLGVFILLLLQGGFLLGFAIVKHSPLDAGIRQFLFILPVCAVFSGIGLSLIYRQCSRGFLKIIYWMILCVLSLPILRDMYALHPFQYVYFNYSARMLYDPIYRNFESDYLGVSMGEAIKWLNVNRQSKEARVFVNGPLHSVLPFADRSLQIAHLAHTPADKVIPPFYYIANPRGNWEKMFSQCKQEFVVERKLGKTVMPLSVVKFCGQ